MAAKTLSAKPATMRRMRQTDPVFARLRCVSVRVRAAAQVRGVGLLPLRRGKALTWHRRPRRQVDRPSRHAVQRPQVCAHHCGAPQRRHREKQHARQLAAF